LKHWDTYLTGIYLLKNPANRITLNFSHLVASLST
jgi:hypothetical protein